MSTSRLCTERVVGGARIGVVVIGRNEGERLRHCLESVRGRADRIVYVDSDSSDGSPALAGGMGVDVLALDLSTPFSAGRARNEGFHRLLEIDPGIEFVQFVDGDCTLDSDWPKAARTVLESNPEYAACMGHLFERNADASPYNRLCAMEWRSPAGVVKDFGGFGGIAMIRTQIFSRLGGYDPTVIAGEDSEMGVRMALAGYQVVKIDSPMAIHDADITRFGQWWRRAVRAGHAIGQRAYLNGGSALKDCIRERNSTLFWGMGLPLLSLSLAIPSRGLSLLLLGGYVVLGYRIKRYRLDRGDSPADAWLYMKYTLIGKFANALGLLRFQLNKMKREYLIIEYK